MFSKLLNEDFSSYLRISREDLGNAQELFAHRRVITVIGPNGIKYDIGTKMTRERVILKKGWAEFCQAHHLCNTDKLMFTCGCHGHFIVLIFDKNGMLVENCFGPSEVEEDNRNDKEAQCQSNKETRLPRKRKDEIVSGHKNRNDKEAQCQSKREKVVASSSTLPDKRKDTGKQCKQLPAKPEVISFSSESDSSDNDAGKRQATKAQKPCGKRGRNDKEAQPQCKKEVVVASSSILPRKRKENADQQIKEEVQDWSTDDSDCIIIQVCKEIPVIEVEE